MKFSDLKIGDKFYFDDSKTLTVKLPGDMYINLSNNDILHSHDDVPCTREPIIIGEFSILAVGARFRFLNDVEYCVKVTNDKYSWPSGGVSRCKSDKKCIVLKKLTFEDVVIGAWFCYPGDLRIRVKVSETEYRMLGDTMSCYPERLVEPCKEKV